MKIALVVGHGYGDPGAVAGDTDEHGFAFEIATLAADILRTQLVETRVVDECTIEAEALIVNAWPAELAIIIHLNAFGGSIPQSVQPDYSLFLCDQRSPFDSLSRRWLVQAKALCDLLGTRGLKVGEISGGSWPSNRYTWVQNRGWRCIAAYRPPVVLAEPCFITNPDRLAWLEGPGTDCIAWWIAEVTRRSILSRA